VAEVSGMPGPEPWVRAEAGDPRYPNLGPVLLRISGSPGVVFVLQVAEALELAEGLLRAVEATQRAAG
jgi:hypothetical protein